MLRGEGFPRNTSLQLVWQTSVGSRVSGSGFAPQENVVAQVKVGSDGRLDLPVTIPKDLGGMHALELRSGEIASSLARSLRSKPVSSASRPRPEPPEPP